MNFRKRSMAELGRIEAEAFEAKHPVVLILDNVRSALNVGSAFRTADALGMAGLGLCGITAQPPHREILKTALGATASVPWQYFEQTEEALAHYQAQGYWLVGVEQLEPSTLLQDWQPVAGQPLALVFGNEVEGLSEAALPYLNQGLEIPQFGAKHSLNVSVAMGIVLWDYVAKMLKV